MTGNPKLDKIISLVSLFTTLACTGVVIYSHTQIKPPPTDQNAESLALQTKADEENSITPFALKPMVVNIPGTGTRLRYLEVEISALPFEEASKEIFKEKIYLFQNALVILASQMQPDELMSVTGKLLLETRLKKTVNDQLGDIKIKQIFFSKFIVQ